MVKIMDFDLHPSAIANFNEKAETLCGKLVIIASSVFPKKSSFHPEFLVASEITEKDIIGDVKFSVPNVEGEEVGLGYLHKGKKIGLFHEGYLDLLKLSQNMQRTTALNSFVSVSFIKNNIIEWIKYKYLNETQSSMVDYIIDKCRKEVNEYEIWIPIPGISVQSDFKIGNMILKSISKDIIDLWLANSNNKNELTYINNERKELQGHAATTIKLNAEPERAMEIAVTESEKAISILRIFSPANLSPHIMSFCTLAGYSNLEKRKYFLFNNGKLFMVRNDFVDIERYHSMVISDKTVSMFKDMGLQTLSDILCQESRNDFQDQVLTSLFLYSRSSIAKEISDKLVYILVSLESILLNDASEPITQNVGDRMAYLIASPKRRQEVVQNVKEIYKLRSSYIHHGKNISYEDGERVKKFMLNSWQVNQFLIHNINKFENKIKFIEYIDGIKYGVI